ncbi:hypothetical protein Pint_26869 [Pistacia integerrima]|uniref:Uncharacterized protein n=1 Tax=Pistacia integerrima TaxID=434235 RepID=A0ACC0YSF9_9ROSI|nr:hypothetical protein Pint_26869 [Pistacia integerrima]
MFLLVYCLYFFPYVLASYFFLKFDLGIYDLWKKQSCCLYIPVKVIL